MRALSPLLLVLCVAACGTEVVAPGADAGGGTSPSDAGAALACHLSYGPPGPQTCVRCSGDAGINVACPEVCIASPSLEDACVQAFVYDGGAGAVKPCGPIGCTDGCDCIDSNDGICQCVVP